MVTVGSDVEPVPEALPLLLAVARASILAGPAAAKEAALNASANEDAVFIVSNTLIKVPIGQESSEVEERSWC